MGTRIREKAKLGCESTMAKGRKGCQLKQGASRYVTVFLYTRSLAGWRTVESLLALSLSVEVLALKREVVGSGVCGNW
jgi:hypothetical protein